MNDRSIEILNKVKSGEISVEEGARLLQSLETGSELEAGTASASGEASHPGQPPIEASTGAASIASTQVIEAPPEEDFQPDLGWWKKFWLIPFWVGTGILVLGALLMGWAFSNQRFFWFYCAWLPMLLGLLVLFLSWWSQQARWVHVRVKDADGTRVAISLPLPLGLAGWALRVFGRFIPKMDEKVLEELPEIFSALAKEKGPTAVEVNEKDGSRVRVYIV